MPIHSRNQSRKQSHRQSTTGIGTAWHLIGSKWKVEIVWQLRMGRSRFIELRNKIIPISDRMLAQSLKELEKAELISREVFAEVPPRVEYQLTPHGESLLPILKEFNAWGVHQIVSTLKPSTESAADIEWL